MAKPKKQFVDPDKLLDQLIENDFDLTQFNQIDERDIVQPPNFVEWIVGRDFCNATLLPWQIEAGMWLFSDFCPDCSNPEYTKELFDESMGEIFDNITFLNRGVCLKCKKNRLELFTVGDIGPRPSIKTEFIGNIGQRSGKCLGENTEVLTPQGPVAIKDLLEGSTVYGWNPDGSVSETLVLHKWDSGIKPVRDLTSRGRLLATSTDEHRWLTIRANSYYRSNLTFQEIQLKEFKDNKDIGIARKFVQIPCGTVQEPHAYAIGALLGDGCSRHGTRNTIDISSETDIVPNRVASILGASVQRNSEQNYTWHIRAGKTWSRDELICNYYQDWCNGHYAHEKICDLEVIKSWDRQSCLEFLAGLIDTDGSVYSIDGERLSIQFGCQSKSVVEAFNYLVYRLFQYKPTLHEDKREKYKNGSVYSGRISSTLFAILALKELDPYLASPSKKWKPEYQDLGTHNSNLDFTRPKVGEPYLCQTYDIEVGNETNLYVLAHEGLITHNSKFVGCASSYQMNRWLAEPDPLAIYGLPRMEVVLGTFSALSAEQAEENLWMPFKGLYDDAPWIKKYNEFLKDHEKKMGIPLQDIKETYIFYPHKRLMVSFTGSDDRKKRGRTRLFGAIDEIAYLNSEQGSSKKVMDADKNYAALNNSLSTIRISAIRAMQDDGRYDLPMPVMYNASSPYNVQDKIMRLTKAAADNPLAVVIHRATWECNPMYTEKACRAINPSISQVEFERDFGAIPPYSDSPFIGDVRVMEKLCIKAEDFTPIVHAHREIYTDPMGDRYLYLRAAIPKYDKFTPQLLSIDQGYNHNAFGASILGWDAQQKKTVCRFLVSLYPEASQGLTLHFPMMYEHFILPLVKALNIKHVFYDRWQSLDQIQRLRALKVNAIAHSLSYEKDMLPFKQQLLSGNMILPPCEVSLQTVKDSNDPLVMTRDKPTAHLIWQSLTVREVGKKVLKPLTGDDDLFRAFMLGASRFLHEDIQKEYASYNGVRQGMMGGKFLGSFNSLRKDQNAGLSHKTSGVTVMAKYRGFGRK
jgi:hypothetical protein